MHLAHPLGVKGFRYRRVKNDVRDAGDLADRLRMGRLPEAWIAPPQTRELRELVRYRAKLVAIRSGLKAQIHAVLAKAGVLIAVSDLFGVGGRQRLAKVALGGAYAERVRSVLELIDVLDGHEAQFAEMIAKRLDAHRGYQAIQQVPGIGPVLAAVFVAEIGDVNRFGDPAHLCSWAGLTPRHRESDTVVHRGHITKQGSKLVRWAAIEAVHATRRRPRSSPTRTVSKLAAARTSPRSPRHANCSRWSTTGYATATSARSTVPGQREHSGPNPCAAASCHDPRTLGVAAILIDPRVATAPLHAHNRLGEGMTGSRNSPALPQCICTITALEKAHNHTIPAR